MKPRNRYLYLKAALRCVDSAGNPVQPLCLHMICPDAILFFKAKEYRADPFYFLNCRKLIVFPVQNNVPILRQKIKNFRFCASYTVAVP